MRLLFVTNRYPPHMTGGYELVAQLVADGLCKRGHQVDILTSTYGVKRRIVEGNVHRLLHLTWGSHHPHKLALWEATDLLAVQRLIRKLRPDCICIWGGLGLFPSLLKEIAKLDIPLIYDIHDLWLSRTLRFAQEWSSFWQNAGRGIFGRILKPLLKNALSLLHPAALRQVAEADLKLKTAIFVSKAEQTLSQEKGFTFPTSAIIYNGVDVQKFSPRQKSHSKQFIKALFVGRLVESKGVHIALQAMQHLVKDGRREILLAIVGVVAPPIEYFESLKSFITKHELEEHVEFLEPKSNEAMPDVYNDYDVLILPSHKEGFSMVIVEAMACGLVVVGTTAGGSAEILRHEENSLTFPVDDSKALAAQFARLMEENELRETLSKNAVTLVRQHFTVEAMIEQREHFLLEVIGHKN